MLIPNHVYACDPVMESCGGRYAWLTERGVEVGEENCASRHKAKRHPDIRVWKCGCDCHHEVRNVPVQP